MITEAPKELAYGTTATLVTPNAHDIEWLELIRPMATTHSCDTEQRLVDLPFQRRPGCQLELTVPANRNLAPPGYYLLFAVNKRRIPSFGRWVHLR